MGPFHPTGPVGRFLVSAVLAAMLAACAGRGSGGMAIAERQLDELFVDNAGDDRPGCVVGFQKGDRLVFAKAYGMADLDAGTPLTTHSVFDLASVSKQFTAASVLLLAGEGTVALDRDVHSYVPELPDYGRPVTIEQMIHHTSGLPDYIGLLYDAGFSDESRTDDSDALRVLSTARRLEFRPGSRYEYSNTGYFLLSRVVLAATGRSLREVSAERIFEPLGMSATSYRDGAVETPTNTAQPYQHDSGRWKKALSDWRQTGDGSVFATIGDLLRWASNFWTRKVGGESLFRAMTTSGRLNDGSSVDYGGGLELENDDGLVLSHTGSWAGYESALIIRPADKVAAGVVCNNARDDAYEYASTTLDVLRK